MMYIHKYLSSLQEDMDSITSGEDVGLHFVVGAVGVVSVVCAGCKVFIGIHDAYSLWLLIL